MDVQAVLKVGATRFRSLVPQDKLNALLHSYNDALQDVFVLAIVLCGLSFMAGFGLEWKSMKRSGAEAEHSSDPDKEIR